MLFRSTGAGYVKAPDFPPEIGKMVLSILFSIEQLPTDFDFASLQAPINPKEYTDHCIAEIERLIVYDDDLASSPSGIECMMMLSKWQMNAGRPRRAWLMNRRALDFGQLTGMHLSTTKPPRPDDVLSERRLKLWSYLVFIDRYICLLLGLPYAVSDAFFLPQVKLRLQRETTGILPYCMRLGLVLGPMIDRNQDPSKMSLPTTLRMDQDLEEITQQMPIEFGSLDQIEANHDGVMVQFIHHYVRSLLHLPLMLKSTNDPRYRYYHDAAVESSRAALMTYKILRSSAGVKPYICKIVDFQAFTVAMLLIIHLLGYSDEAPNHSEVQDERDWDLVMAVIDVLRNAATERGGTVAEQSAQILTTIYNCHSSPFPNLNNELSCKITVPYFGVLNISPGRKLSNRSNKGYCPQNNIILPLHTPDQASPDKLFTPPQSSLCGSARSEYSAMDSIHTLCTPPTNYIDEPWFQLVSLPNTGLDMSGSRGLPDDHDLNLWSNMDLDLDLDQGWNLNWSEDGNAIITQ